MISYFYLSKLREQKHHLESKIEEIPGQFLTSLALVGFNVFFNGDFKKNGFSVGVR